MTVSVCHPVAQLLKELQELDRRQDALPISIEMAGAVATTMLDDWESTPPGLSAVLWMRFGITSPLSSILELRFWIL